MIVLGLDLAKLNWYFILYIIACVVGLIYGTREVYALGQVRGVIFAIGAILVLIYFGFRWFGNKTHVPKSWPPIINMCPDYLTYVSRLPGCVDMLGVTKSSAGIQVTKPSEVNSVALTNTQKVFEFTSEDIKAATTTADLQKICDRCQQAGITWEGVYDGDVCMGISKFEEDSTRKEKCLVSV